MSEIGDLTAARDSLRDLARIVRSTRQTLATAAREQRTAGRSFSHRPGQLSDTLQHLEEVREGFIISQRTSTQANLSELSALVHHVLMDWAWVEALNWALNPADEIASPNPQLMFFNHALVALATLPHLPPYAVTFPQKWPSYADVPAPALPGELLARIEEIERVIYQAEAMPGRSPEYNPFRRTYAFFEASTWLVNNYLEDLLK